MAVIHSARPAGEHESAHIRQEQLSTAAFVCELGPERVHQPFAVPDWQTGQHAFNGNSWLTAAVHGFFANGGTRLIVCNTGAPADDGDRVLRHVAALEALEAERDVALICAPGRTEPAIQNALLDHCEAMRTRFAILDGPSEIDVSDILRLPKPRESLFGAYYFPWISVDAGRGLSPAPPSGHIAGFLARLERERGIHRAPANDILRGAVAVRHSLTRADEDFLTARSVNCLRDIGERGIRVFGAMTLSSNGLQNQIRVRRTAAMIERSIDRGVERLLAGGEALSSIEERVRTFLGELHRAGVLAEMPEEDLTVHCAIEGGFVLCSVLFAIQEATEKLSVRVPLRELPGKEAQAI